MTKTTMLALVLALVGACGDGLDVADDGSATDITPIVEDAKPCCRQYPSGLAVPGCWMCADGVLRCVGMACEAGSATMPLCRDQPVTPWPSTSPSCD